MSNISTRLFENAKYVGALKAQYAVLKQEAQWLIHCGIRDKAAMQKLEDRYSILLMAMDLAEVEYHVLMLLAQLDR